MALLYFKKTFVSLLTLATLMATSERVLSLQADEILDSRGRNFLRPAQARNEASPSAATQIAPGNILAIGRLLPAREACWFFRVATKNRVSANLRSITQEWENVSKGITRADLSYDVPYHELHNFRAFHERNAPVIQISEETIRILNSHFDPENREKYVLKVYSKAYLLAQRFDCLEDASAHYLIQRLMPHVNDLDSVCDSVQCFHSSIIPNRDVSRLLSLVNVVTEIGENRYDLCLIARDIMRNEFDYPELRELCKILNNLGPRRTKIVQLAKTCNLRLDQYLPGDTWMIESYLKSLIEYAEGREPILHSLADFMAGENNSREINYFLKSLVDLWSDGATTDECVSLINCARNNGLIRKGMPLSVVRDILLFIKTCKSQDRQGICAQAKNLIKEDMNTSAIIKEVLYPSYLRYTGNRI